MISIENALMSSGTGVDVVFQLTDNASQQLAYRCEECLI
jgi:hypothetical protein